MTKEEIISAIESMSVLDLADLAPDQFLKGCACQQPEDLSFKLIKLRIYRWAAHLICLLFILREHTLHLNTAERHPDNQDACQNFSHFFSPASVFLPPL